MELLDTADGFFRCETGRLQSLHRLHCNVENGKAGRVRCALHIHANESLTREHAREIVYARDRNGSQLTPGGDCDRFMIALKADEWQSRCGRITSGGTSHQPFDSLGQDEHGLLDRVRHTVECIVDAIPSMPQVFIVYIT